MAQDILINDGEDDGAGVHRVQKHGIIFSVASQCFSCPLLDYLKQMFKTLMVRCVKLCGV